MFGVLLILLNEKQLVEVKILSCNVFQSAVGKVVFTHISIM